MNPRQRRGALLLVLAGLGALAVFFAVLVFVAGVNRRVGDVVDVVVLKHDVQAYHPIGSDDLEMRSEPQQWLPQVAIRDPADVVGLVPLTSLPGGAMAQQGMFTARPGVRPGYREVAILVDAETGVAGKIKSGDRVDIIATAGAAGTGRGSDTRKASVWVGDALIIDVGLPEDVRTGDQTGGFNSEKAVPVTFALPVKDALRVAYAESFAVKVRLALRGAGDASVTSPGDLSYSEVAGSGRAKGR